MLFSAPSPHARQIASFTGAKTGKRAAAAAARLAYASPWRGTKAWWC